MKTLNEQIQRLRDILHTCYESIASKGGTLPPVGERNMTNLPDAVESVPQVIAAELEELTITQNGEYLPSEGVAGFSKVTAEFDTSSLPKVKVSLFKVTNGCINDDGIWEGENLIDTSEVTNYNDAFRDNTKIKRLESSFNTSNFTGIASAIFRGCSNLEYINTSNWDLSNITKMQYIFAGCYELVDIDVSNWNVANCTGAFQLFYNCSSLVDLDVSNWNVQNFTDLTYFIANTKIKQLNLTKWEINNSTNINHFAWRTYTLESLVGGMSIDDVIANNTTIFKGLSRSTNNVFENNLDRASLRALINGLADLTGQTAQTLTLGATLLAKLTEEDIAIATNKNWTLS